MLDRSWVEIDLKQIAENVDVYKSCLPNGKRIMAVVKADAYGHGDVEVSAMLFDKGIRDFAVSNIEEAERLRRAGITGDILILGYTPIGRINELIEYDITQAVISEDYAEAVLKTKKRIKCSFAIDTGMNRLGISAHNIKDCVNTIIKYNEAFDITGVFTHLCVADNNGDKESVIFTEKQLELYNEVLTYIGHLKLKNNHCLNSAGGLWYRDGTGIVRLGIMMYGLKPNVKSELPEGIKPAMHWKSVVAMMKDVKKGNSIGYGRTYYANSDMKIAIIPTGYADGYSRLLSNKGYVIIGGKKANIVGRICMDQFMADVTDIYGLKAGEEVTLMGRDGDEQITADDIADIIGTIGYEVVCGISKRVPRIYVKT